MGMSTYVIGIKSKTSLTFQKHERIMQMCMEEKVSLPIETADYFGVDYPCQSAVDEILEVDLGNAATEWSNDNCSGYEVNIKDLPKDIDVIRFYNSY